MNTEVVAVSSKEPTEPYYHFSEFKRSLERFGTPPTILGFGEPWHGLMTKPRLLQRFLMERRNKSDNLIVTDAWDILFAAHPDEVWDAKMRVAPDAILFNAENSCFPRADLAPLFPDPGTPHRYLNSGFMAGSAQSILALLDSMNLSAIRDDTQEPDGSWFNPNDQEYYTLAFLQQPVKMVLDTRCEVCQSFAGCELEQFDTTGERVLNKGTGSRPLVWHFPGNAKNAIMPVLLQKLAL